MANKRANGEGSIKRRPNGTWEARYSFDGRQQSIYGKTKADVREKLTAILSSIDSGEYVDETDMTVSEWLNEWQSNYLVNIKNSTREKYAQDIRVHVAPSLGSVKLSKLTSLQLQRFYNKMLSDGLSPKTVKCVHGMVHKSLSQAVKIGYLARNVSDMCELPKSQKKEMLTLEGDNISRFLSAIKGDAYEYPMFVTMFTGMREAEIVGLTWDCINFEKGSIKLYRQFSKERKYGGGGEYKFTSLKNGKSRIIFPAQQVMDVLRKAKAKQTEWKFMCGDAWCNTDNFVFTNPLGGHITTHTLYVHFKSAVKKIGIDDIRFHDLRHTYATLSLQNGSDIKTISSDLGHATTAFTMDVYGHVTEKMRKENASRMEQFISGL